MNMMQFGTTKMIAVLMAQNDTQQKTKPNRTNDTFTSQILANFNLFNCQGYVIILLFKFAFVFTLNSNTILKSSINIISAPCG